MTTNAAVRWRPARAGILNVYQYEDETLHFADGRLLLRGVNGSGKSTAMNMLLPFLLEADTRRIDAAGEQTGVLTSWMLADNDENQRTGYLWLEFARQDPTAPGGVLHHSVGCGIRANRSTNRTTSWWFCTPRRPGIEFSLTSNRVALSIEALRAELGSDAVFTTAKEYRGEVSSRFFGGTDPSGYLTLLHQVRNPRVGDRIDADLPQRIAEALPPVPADAVLDAARPLEDLEKHRKNIDTLACTDRALSTMLATYREYARRVLARAADRARDSATAVRSATRAQGRLRTAVDEAIVRRDGLKTTVEELEATSEQIAATRNGVAESDAYRQVATLSDRRKHVHALEEQATKAAKTLDQAVSRVNTAAETVKEKRGRLDGDLADLGDLLAAATRHGRVAGVRLPLPPLPTLLTTLHSETGLLASDADPLAGLDLTAAADAVRAQKETVKRVRPLLAQAEQTRTDCDTAQDAAATAEKHAVSAQEEAETARLAVEDAGVRHRSVSLEWSRQWTAHVAAVPAPAPGEDPEWLPVPVIVDPGQGELRDMAAARARAARASVEEASRNVDTAVAEAALRVRQAREHHQEISDELSRLRAASTMQLPRPSWQGPGQEQEQADSWTFAALVDFSPGLDDAARAGLEAACEAAGLLTASVRPDGSVLSRNGELLLIADGQAHPNLTTQLVPVPGNGIDVETIFAVLAAVGAGPASGAALWVSVDGTFGTGPLRGLHGKSAAEHIGARAREIARHRRIAALEKDLALAEQQVSCQEKVRTALTAWRETANRLLKNFPTTRELDEAVVAAEGAVRDAQRIALQASTARAAAEKAEDRAEQAWNRAEHAAAEHHLPVTCAELEQTAEEITETNRILCRATDRLASVRRSVKDWHDAITIGEEEGEALEEAREDAGNTRSLAMTERQELTAIEDALGDTETQLADRITDLTRRQEELTRKIRAHRAEHAQAIETASREQEQLNGAQTAVENAEDACTGKRETLSSMLAVEGLLLAACEGEPEPADDFPQTVDGTSRLAAAIRESVPQSVRDVDENALNRSLFQIRDTLGSGWDAEIRRDGDGIPVAVMVFGPNGRFPLALAAAQVGADLRRARGLLSVQQDQALRNLLHGRVAREVAHALFEAGELIRTMNTILSEVTTTQGIGVRLDWRTRGDLDQSTATALRLLAKDPEARTETEDNAVRAAVAALVEEARQNAPDTSYQDIIAQVLDYRTWHELKIYVRRPGRSDERLRRRTTLSEGEKKLVTYLPMAAAAAASAAAHDPHGVGAPRLILLDDAFAKVSEDNHERLFGLLISLDLDFIVTSERLFGTHASVPELSIVEVLRDASLRTIALMHYHWDGRHRRERAAERPAGPPIDLSAVLGAADEGHSTEAVHDGERNEP